MQCRCVDFIPLPSVKNIHKVPPKTLTVILRNTWTTLNVRILLFTAVKTLLGKWRTLLLSQSIRLFLLNKVWNWTRMEFRVYTGAMSWEEKSPWKRPWCWKRVKARGEGDDRGRDVWTVSPKLPTWIWPNSGRQWKIGRPGVLWSMGSRRVRHDLTTKQQQQYFLSYCLL